MCVVRACVYAFVHAHVYLLVWLWRSVFAACVFVCVFCVYVCVLCVCECVCLSARIVQYTEEIVAQ